MIVLINILPIKPRWIQEEKMELDLFRHTDIQKKKKTINKNISDEIIPHNCPIYLHNFPIKKTRLLLEGHQEIRVIGLPRHVQRTTALAKTVEKIGKCDKS